MGRSGYSEDYGDDDPLAMGRYRGAVQSAMRGRRGQAFFKELLAAFDAMPEKKLIAESLKIEDGAVCSLGAVALRRGMDAEKIQQLDVQFECENQAYVAQEFGIAECMAREIVFMNDECSDGHYEVDIYDGKRRWYAETPEERWTRMRNWVASQINPDQQ